MKNSCAVWFTKNFDSENPSWSRANAGMKDVRITDLDMRDDYKVFASTYGLGVYSSIFTETGGEPTFRISTDVDDITIFKGETGSFNINIRALNDFNENVQFSIDGLPENTIESYDPDNNIIVNQDGILRIDLSISENAEVKSYPLTINATSNTQSKTLGILLEVTSDDVDEDGVKNDVDNCPETYNPNQQDLDGDNIGDVCDCVYLAIEGPPVVCLGYQYLYLPIYDVTDLNISWETDGDLPTSLSRDTHLGTP